MDIKEKTKDLPSFLDNTEEERTKTTIILVVLFAIIGSTYVIGGFFTLSHSFILSFFSIFLFLIALVFFITAVGLWNGRGWAKPIAIILSIIHLIDFPLGTIVGIVILVILFSEY